MRLKEIKLAGFKSFVDPTHIPIPGQVVGIVGPNGCGKSNVIDAVRWVLGESSARHLRGETMQDVIFNGAGERKPGNRASVELIFDNTLAKVAGEWASYAEIAIKRVLEREGSSEYYINGVHVRRRDVADLFLGTGVGARAYGIIEQGMISQIIEAKPEELRVFLEEAAGVSKYRERRRETELRIADTRDNLQRVTDIREELDKQLGHLQAQAQVAAKYRELQNALSNAHQLLWLVRKQEAAAQRNRSSRDLERATIEVEAELARLRDAEKRGEALRLRFYAANDAVSGAQGAFFQAGSEVARLEQQLQFLRASRARVESQRAQVDADLEQCSQQQDLSRASREQWRAKLAAATGQLETLLVRVAAESERVPLAEAAFRQAQDAVRELRDELARIDQQLHLQDARREHAAKLLAQLEARSARLEQERAALVVPDDAALRELRSELQAHEDELRELRAALERHEGELPRREQATREAQQSAAATASRITALDARRCALEALQARLARGEHIKTWLEQHALAGHKRLWQGMRIEQGWEDALEAVLEERLNAIGVERLAPEQSWWREPPPAKLALFSAENGSAASAAAGSWHGLPPLASFVTCLDSSLAAVLPEWLDGVYVIDGAAAALELRHEAPLGAVLVTREGHVFTRHSVSFHAPDSELHGVLSRQREIDQIGEQIALEQTVLDDRRRGAGERESALAELRNSIASLRFEIDTTQEKAHGMELEILRLSEQADRSTQRGAQIAAELGEIAQQSAQEGAERDFAQAELARLNAQRLDLDARLAAADTAFRGSEEALAQQRRALQEAEKESQAALFSQRTCTQRIEDLEAALRVLEEQLTRLRQTGAELAADLARFDETALSGELQAALGVRGEREAALAKVRDEQQGLEAELRAAEQERLGSEQRLEPLRLRINDLRLKEQEARLTEEQFERQLVDAGADQEALKAQLERGVRSSHLNTEIGRLGEEIAALGAVNLAALDELNAARERKAYLDTQSADLEQALATLESAIRRIDRETRELLAKTFDEVNRHFGEMFPSLFGGGTAKLVLTGEEILDAGIQVVAQPPGKRNSSIHLLSGGEKALTALALIFSMFQLNPAPFCLLDEVDAPLDDSNTLRFCSLVKRMAAETQFMFISHNKLTMEIAEQLIGVTMQELGVSRVVAVDIEEALKLTERQAA
ncbi:MAG: chromosome segregation protein SMC [Burkholderiales bacterium]|nr:chromosome segregation protein SMC [Burkholderiales bacterium]